MTDGHTERGWGSEGSDRRLVADTRPPQRTLNRTALAVGPDGRSQREMRIGQLVEALGIGVGPPRTQVADPMMNQISLFLMHRERTEVAAVGANGRERLLRRRPRAVVRFAARSHQMHRHVSRGSVDDERGFVLVGRERLA